VKLKKYSKMQGSENEANSFGSIVEDSELRR
jgi:hypothetical protein